MHILSPESGPVEWQLIRKLIKKINAVYSLDGTVLENVDNIKYLSVTISKDLKWNIQVLVIQVSKQNTWFLKT